MGGVCDMCRERVVCGVVCVISVEREGGGCDKCRERVVCVSAVLQ